MKRLIRKLIIGNPYGDKKFGDAPMKFVVGSPIGLRDGNKTHIVSRIKFLHAHFQQTNERLYEIWLEDSINKTEKCWKIQGVGTSERFQEEYDLDF